MSDRLAAFRIEIVGLQFDGANRLKRIRRILRDLAVAQVDGKIHLATAGLDEVGDGWPSGCLCGIISFFKRRRQSAIDTLDATLHGKAAVQSAMNATLCDIEKLP